MWDYFGRSGIPGRAARLRDHSRTATMNSHLDPLLKLPPPCRFSYDLHGGCSVEPRPSPSGSTFDIFKILAGSACSAIFWRFTGPLEQQKLDPRTIDRIQSGLVEWLITILPFLIHLWTSNPCVSTCSLQELFAANFQFWTSARDQPNGIHIKEIKLISQGCPKAPPHPVVRGGARGDYSQDILLWIECCAVWPPLSIAFSTFFLNYRFGCPWHFGLKPNLY